MESKKTCPYTFVKSKVSGFANFLGLGSEEKVDTNCDVTQLTQKTFDTEKGIELNKLNDDNKSNPNSQSKCPFSKNQTKSDKTETKDTIEDEEEQPSGGCPMMGQKRKDPDNRHYEAFYEIPRFGQYDFLFVLPGNLEQEEFLEKTKRLRAMPRHLKYTLVLQGQEKLQKVHEKEFPVVFFMYDDLKEKGNRLFQKKKYREAIEHYIYSYGLLKWIQFKDKKRQAEFITKPSLEAILDEDIEEKHVYLDDVKVEEDSYKACIVYILMNLSSVYMELRHFSEALKCLDECIEIAQDKLPDLFFRRSQARTYNKNSCDEDLEMAMKDIEKAIELKDQPIYKEHKEKLIIIIKEKKELLKENQAKIMSKVKNSYQKIKSNNLEDKDVIYTKKGNDAHTQYKILKE